MECASILDALRIMESISEVDLHLGKSMLSSIAGILTKVVRG